MYKMKTHSGAKKRFRKSKSGLIKGAHAYRRHRLTKKSPKQKSHLRKPLYFSKADQPVLRSLLPYL